MVAQRQGQRGSMELAAIALGATSPKITEKDLERYKRLNPEERLTHLRRFAEWTISTGESPFSLRSLEAKLAMIESVQSKLAAKGIQGIVILPECQALTFDANPIGLLRGETYERSINHRLYHYAVCGRTHEVSQDYVLTILFDYGNIHLELDAVLDGVSGCADGKLASHTAGHMLAMAAKLGLVTSGGDVYRLICAINRELYNMRIQPGAPWSVQTDAVIALIDRTNKLLRVASIFQCGTSQALLITVDRRLRHEVLTRPNRPFLGTNPILPGFEAICVASPTLAGGVDYLLALPSDGFVMLSNADAPERFTESVLGFMTGQTFAGFGRIHRPPVGQREIGRGDDASLLLTMP